MSAFIDRTNAKFGRLTARWFAGRSKTGPVIWLCSCDCGKYCLVRTDQLSSGNSSSCGCLQRELSSAASRMRRGPLSTSFRHGHCVNGKSTAEYKAFDCARHRCNNPDDPAYQYYGGRGIKFIFSSFEDFLAEIGPKPHRHLTLDRIENNGHYEPGNIRWATHSQQQSNRRLWNTNDEIPVCQRGHSLKAENIYVRPDGERACRICRRLGRK
jgi:hypothetical protein